MAHPPSCAAWRQINNAASGPLVRRLHGGRLTDRSVALIVKAAATRVGLDPADFGGHSLRAGTITSTADADADADETAIMEQTGHRSTEWLRDYMRAGRLFYNNAAAVTGL